MTTEYITKAQAIDVINTAFGHIYDSDSAMVSLVDLQNEIIMTIEQHTEPADVAPVVHGRWAYRKRHEGSQRILTGPLVTGKYPNRITHWDNEVSILFDDRYEWDKPFCSLCGRAAEMPDYMFWLMI